MFLDEASILVRSGSGGNGLVSFRREKYIPRGGPDGGDGGRGGHVVLRASRTLSTLREVSRKAIWCSPDGRPGGPNNRSGRRGRDLTILVPVGTLVREIIPGVEPREGRVLCDFLSHGDFVQVARGGRGGRGNKSFATATYQVPREAETGEPGEEKRLYLELKLLADVGLVGLPNAGKSTLLSRISAARPKVADYPFTTLDPHLGMVETSEYRRLVFADIPGIIAGAHEGVGLGIEFLRHVERTRVLVHLVSVESMDPDRMAEDYRTVDAELHSHSSTLAEKPRLVVASKVDLLDEETRSEITAGLSSRLGRTVIPLSAVTGAGVRDLLVEATRVLDASPPGAEAPVEPEGLDSADE